MVDNATVVAQVDRPLETMLQRVASPQNGSARTAAVDRVVAELHATLRDAVASVGWTHGDFRLGNILTSRDGERITGLVDWDDASPTGLYGVDVVTLGMTTQACVDYVDIGRVVRAWLVGDPSSAALSRLMSASRYEGCHAIDETSLVLLSWIAHVSTKLDTCPEYGRRAKWVHNNVDLVLDVFRRPHR